MADQCAQADRPERDIRRIACARDFADVLGSMEAGGTEVKKPGANAGLFYACSLPADRAAA